ncbi:hypothetical protein EJB05_25782 [Eragrostis curvula]|uniref:Uncharacterized protein n=1 Tax=Eragrostis curvula TaxID=38414 RepID=A0A5J9UJF8_9POAL|nr:hypothetical protein EJB05_25782 [Eragrostis curvula]
MPPSTAGYHAQPPQRSSEASTIVVGQKLKEQLEERLTSMTKVFQPRKNLDMVNAATDTMVNDISKDGDEIMGRLMPPMKEMDNGLTAFREDIMDNGLTLLHLK